MAASSWLCIHYLYNLAEEVVIWLGLASSGGDLAIDVLRSLARRVSLTTYENASQLEDRTKTPEKVDLADTVMKLGLLLGRYFADHGSSVYGFPRRWSSLENAKWFVVLNSSLGMILQTGRE